MSILRDFKRVMERRSPSIPSTVFRCKIYPGGLRCRVALKRGKKLLLHRDLYRSAIEEAIDIDVFAQAIGASICLRFEHLCRYQ